MTTDEIRTAVIEVLISIAPRVNAAAIDPQANFRDQFDFDSMDFLNFAIGLSQRLAVEIPERDYPKLSSLNGCIAYLRDRPGATA